MSSAPVGSGGTEFVAHPVDGSANWATSVTGATNAYFETLAWQIGQERVFTEGKLKARKAARLNPIAALRYE